MLMLSTSNIISGCLFFFLSNVSVCVWGVILAILSFLNVQGSHILWFFNGIMVKLSYKVCVCFSVCVGFILILFASIFTLFRNVYLRFEKKTKSRGFSRNCEGVLIKEENGGASGWSFAIFFLVAIDTDGLHTERKVIRSIRM